MCKSHQRSCLRCGSVNTKKDGKRKWRQNYKCKKCFHVWINKSRKKTKVSIWKLYEDFSLHKQTYAELSDSYNISVKTIQKYLDMKIVSRKKVKPRKVILLIDTTYFWNFWLMLFKDSQKKDILNYKIVDYETNSGYENDIRELMIDWREIESIIYNGRRGLLLMFSKIPTQMCHFHQRQIIRRYITKTPILEPSIKFNDIMIWLTCTNKWTF